MSQVMVLLAAMLAASFSFAAIPPNDYIYFTGSTESVIIPPDSDFPWEVEVLVGREVWAAQDMLLMFSGVFSEAALDSYFISGDKSLYNKDAPSPGQPGNKIRRFTHSFNADELMDFRFEIPEGQDGTEVINGNNEAAWNDEFAPTFGVAYFRNSLYIALDDDGAIDFDIDDFVIRAHLPAPGTPVMLIMGLILTLVSRKIRWPTKLG